MKEELELVRSKGIFDYRLLGGDYMRPNDRSFAPGCQLALASGKSKNVEDVVPATIVAPEGGDVLLTLDGEQAFVVGLMKGPEKSPIVEIEAVSKNPNYSGVTFSTKVNESHAVLKDQSHLIAASRLRVDDSIQTNFGEARITKISRTQLPTPVWNVLLASEHFALKVLPKLNESQLPAMIWTSLLGLSPKQHIICCDGILSGDWNIQEQLDGFYRAGVSLTTFA